MSSDTLKSLFGYKSWANRELFALMATLPEQNAEQLRTCIRTLNPAPKRTCPQGGLALRSSEAPTAGHVARVAPWHRGLCRTQRTRHLVHP